MQKKFFHSSMMLKIPNLRSIYNFRLLDLNIPLWGGVYVHTERKSFKNLKPFWFRQVQEEVLMPWPGQEQRQGCGKLSVAEKPQIWQDWEVMLEKLSEVRPHRGSCILLKSVLFHVESPFIWRQGDRLRIEGPEIIHHGLSSSFLHWKMGSIKTFSPRIPRNDRYRARILNIGRRHDF